MIDITGKHTSPPAAPDDQGNLASETLARLYEEQGNFEHAAAIRKKLASPGRWRMELEPCSDSPGGRNRVSVKSEGGQAVLCRWEMTQEAMQIVKRSFPDCLKEHSKALTAVLRVVVVTPDGQSPRRQYRDLELPSMLGICRIEDLPKKPAWLVAAVGLRHASGRFHSTAHSPVLTLEGADDLQPRHTS